MKVAETKTTSVANSLKANQPFFSKEGDGSFFNESRNEKTSFFNTSSHYSLNDKGALQTKLASKPLAAAITPQIQKKCAGCEEEDKMVQRQEQPDESVTKTDTPNPNESPAITPTPRSLRAGKCNSSPEFPNFQCLTYALKLDIDQNLWNNAHQFYRVATLFPDDKELMWNTFLRYGLGVNLLQTSFGFLGVNKTLGTALSYGTGIGLKSFEFLKSGKLELDLPIPLGKGLNLDLKLDLNTDPNDLTKIKGVNTGIGIRGHF